jgi:molecular chaperone Hsp33
VLEGPEGVRAAGGMIVEVMPGAGNGVVARLEENLGRIAGVSRLLEGRGVEGLLDAVLLGFTRETLERGAVRFRCGCSRDGLLDRLVTLSELDRRELADADGRIEAECAFCGAHYLYRVAELDTQ